MQGSVATYPHGQGGVFLGSSERLELAAAASWGLALDESSLASLEADKRALRAQVAARLPEPGSAEHQSASLGAQARLATTAAVRAARCIALYRATRTECATDALAAELAVQGKELCFPRALAEDRILRFVRPHGALRRGSLGIDEHDDAPDARVPLAAIDLFVVPARAVDPLGHRLGRGKGYYDATLEAAGPRAARVCLVFDRQVVPAVPHAAHDQPMSAVCTELRWIDCPPPEPA